MEQSSSSEEESLILELFGTAAYSDQDSPFRKYKELGSLSCSPRELRIKGVLYSSKARKEVKETKITKKKKRK